MKKYLPIALISLLALIFWAIINQINDAADLFEESFDLDDIEEMQIDDEF